MSRAGICSTGSSAKPCKSAEKRAAALYASAAEKKFGGGTRELKFAYVGERIYEIMPGIFQVFFTAEDIAGWIAGERL